MLAFNYIVSTRLATMDSLLNICILDAIPESIVLILISKNILKQLNQLLLKNISWRIYFITYVTTTWLIFNNKNTIPSMIILNCFRRNTRYILQHIDTWTAWFHLHIDLHYDMGYWNTHQDLKNKHQVNCDLWCCLQCTSRGKLLLLEANKSSYSLQSN